MANNTTVPTGNPAAANGPLAGVPFGHQPLSESLVARATRILAGDIRPEDYLPVSDDVLAFVADSEARAGIQLLPEYRQMMINDLALQARHGGEEVLVRYLPDGVIILAVGPEVDDIREQLPAEHLNLVRFAYPAMPL